MLQIRWIDAQTIVLKLKILMSVIKASVIDIEAILLHWNELLRDRTNVRDTEFIYEIMVSLPLLLNQWLKWLIRIQWEIIDFTFKILRLVFI